MSNDLTEQQRIETYAKTLLEAAKSENREILEAQDLEALIAMKPELMNMMAVMNERHELDLLPKVFDLYQQLLEESTGKPVPVPGFKVESTAQESRKADIYAKALLEAAVTEGHEGREVEELQNVLGLTPEVMSLVAVMSERGDGKLLHQVATSYRDLLDRDGNTIPVEVITAVPLDDRLRGIIRKKLEGDLKRKVYFIEKVDPSILGGIILTVRGDRRDASVQAQLSNVRASLMQTEIGGDNQ